MKRRFKTLLIIITILLLFTQTVFGKAIVRKTNKTTSESINFTYELDGRLSSIRFTSSATGASSGIRYRFAEGVIYIGGFEVGLSYIDLVGGAKPPAGVTEYYEVIFTVEAIENSIKTQLGRDFTETERAKFEQALNNPGDIEITATIEIYNANTGKVLDTIRREEDIHRIAGKYGFSNKHMKDMASRFKKAGQELGPPYTETKTMDNPNSGLRPSIIRP